GGKGPVIKHYSQYRSGNVEIKNPLFLLDRDLDPYLDIEPIDDDILVYLKDYCIENYLIEEYAFCSSLSWQLQEICENLIEKGYFKEWENKVVNAFFELFIAFIICRQHELGENAEQSPFNFLQQNSYEPDYDKIQDYIDNLSTLYCNKLPSTNKEFMEEFNSLKEEIMRVTHNNKQTVISGKYLFKSLFKYVQHLCKINKKNNRIDEQWFLGLLTNKLDLDKFSFIRERVIQLYSNHAS
ncbi:DUF4435 domain-containing protein, partial [Priestia megaterium]|uniref:DUF4435 domain-containing protein n=1 Tax=Priestia megaterium TaxID=1404 RepID=UPI00300A123E